MSFRVVVEKEAEEDLKEAARWIAQSSPEKAALWYFGATEAIESLETFPACCPLAPESKRFGVEIRHLLFEKYRILFTIEDETVYVLRVRHQAQDTLKPGSEMKSAKAYYKESYSANLSGSLKGLIKDGTLLESARDTYSLSAAKKTELSSP